MFKILVVKEQIKLHELVIQATIVLEQNFRNYDFHIPALPLFFRSKTPGKV